MLLSSQQLGGLVGHFDFERHEVHVESDGLLKDRVVVVGGLTGDVGVQIGPWHCPQGEVVVGHQLLGIRVRLLDKLFAEHTKVLVPDDPWGRLPSVDPTGQVHVTALQVGSGKNIPHSSRIIKDLRPARPHYHPQVDPLGPGLRRSEVHPTSVQACIALADVPNLERGRTELGVKADPVLADELLVDPVKNGDSGLANDNVLAGAGVDAVDGRTLAA